MPFIHSTPYRISDAANRCCQMNGQPIVNPSRTTRMSTKVNGGAAVGMNVSSNLVNVDLPRNYTDDNSNAIGGDVGPVVFVNLGETSANMVVASTNPNYPGFAAIDPEGKPLAAGDAIRFGNAVNYSGVYRVLSVSGSVCVFNTPFTASGSQEFELVYKQSGTIDQQTVPYTTVGRKGNKMERDRLHQVQHLVLGNEPALVRSGHFHYGLMTYTTGVTYSDRYPSFKVSGTGSQDATVVNHGLSVGGGYAIKLGGKGMRNMKRGRFDGKNETR